MAISRADFELRFPSFADVDAATVDVQLADATARFDPMAFPNEGIYERAVYLLVAHNLTMRGAGAGVEAQIAAGGVALDAVQSVSDGGLSISLRSEGSFGPYGGSQYGRELHHILRNQTARVMTVAYGDAGYVTGSPNYPSRRD